MLRFVKLSDQRMERHKNASSQERMKEWVLRDANVARIRPCADQESRHSCAAQTLPQEDTNKKDNTNKEDNAMQSTLHGPEDR